jgi:IclR family acetate operon transcriptional repressor
MTKLRAASKPLDGTPESSFQVLSRTFAILELFDGARPQWSATEVARTLSLPIPTAHRLLSALARHKYVSQDEDSKRFQLGIAALRLGQGARVALELRTIALPVLRRLAQDTGETSLLTGLTPQQDLSICLERVESTQPLRLSVTPGRQLPLHAGSSQKALAAFMDADSLDRMLASPLEKSCHNTITDPDLLRAEFKKIRALGWALSVEETNVGVWGIALPILNDRGGVTCAVGIAGPSPRYAKERIGEHIVLIHAAAEEIANAIGDHVPPVKTESEKTPK